MTEVSAGSPKGSVFEDVLEVLWAPAKVFDRSRAKGVGMYIVVLTAITLVIVLATKGLIQPYIDANFDLQMQQMAAKGKPMPAEAVAAAQNFAGYGFIAAGVLLIPLGAVLTGLLVWIGGKVASARFTYGQAMLIATLASVPRVLGFVATAVQGAIADPQSIRSFSDAALGAARFVDPTSASPALMALLANLDVFNIWQLVIMAVGISVIGRVERSAGFVGALVAWGVGVALTVVPALLA
ncbi:YIP1 family protein [Gemmatimonas sp.]|uniref:YIP1 family protein n=1 Tax=Gemmatimonas sp. TaxID=1962908 RepID=UPI00356AB18A